MIPRRLQALRSRLSSLYARTEAQTDLVLQSQLARYLCILTVGLVEQTLQAMAVQYSEKHARTEVTAYVSQAVEYVQNPNFERVRQFCGAFSSAWQDKFDQRVLDDARVALNSVHSIRNTLAHGEEYALSFGVMYDYYKRILKLLDLIEEIFEP